MSTHSASTQKSFLSSDYFKVETLPRGSSRHNELVELLNCIHILSESGDLIGAQAALDKAVQNKKFQVSPVIAQKIREEKERANQIFMESAVRTIRYWSKQLALS
jgi:hypothetical protein